MSRIFLLLVLVLCGPVMGGEALDLELVADGFVRPLGLVNAGDGSDRLFVVEQRGVISIIEDGAVLPRPFLDLSDRFSCCGGRLGGLVFHPDYESTGFFYVFHIGSETRSTISRFKVSNADPNRARQGSESVMLTFQRPPGAHSGGDMAFGPDGYLYLASGDGAFGDPGNNAQNLSSPLGKILRLDVDSGPGAVPADNPFVADPDARDEIWAYGLRNPWRISFDRKTGDFFVADVGHSQIEEVNFQSADSPGGENYGWRKKEGSVCFNPPVDCDDNTQVSPIIEYGHDLGCSITGGFRYRGRRAPTLKAHYFFGDFCSGTIWGAEPNRNGVWVSRVLAETGLSIVTFGEDEKGNLYVVDRSGGAVYNLVSREIFADGFESGSFFNWRRKGPVEIVDAGLDGSEFSMAAPAGVGSSAFVNTRVPHQAKNLETSFYLTPREMELAGGEADVLTLADGRGVHLRLALDKISRNRYKAVLWVRDGATGERLVGKARFGWRKTVHLEVDWRSASSPSASDGIARLSKNGSVQAAAQNLVTGARRVTTVKLGLPGGTPAGSSGRLLLDTVSLTR